MKSCSSVPLSFSRTIALAVSITAIIWQRTTIRPGMKKFGDRVSGLNRTRGRASTGSGAPFASRASDSSSAIAAPTFTASAATVDSEPSTSSRTCPVCPAWSRREKTSGILIPTRARPETRASCELLVREDLTDDPEVLGVLEPQEQGPALLGPRLVEDDGPDVPDVGVDRETEQEQFDERDEQREEQRARVADDVQDLLPGHRADPPGIQAAAMCIASLPRLIDRPRPAGGRG